MSWLVIAAAILAVVALAWGIARTCRPRDDNQATGAELTLGDPDDEP